MMESLNDVPLADKAIVEQRIDQLCMKGHEAYKLGFSRKAAEFFISATHLAPNRVDLIWHYAYAAADHDRPGIIARIKEFKECNASDPIAIAKAITIELPYVESLAREAQGLSSYSSDSAFERPFQFCADLVDEWGRNVKLWQDFGGKFSEVAAASHAFVTGDLELCEMHLAECRSGPMIDDRVRAVRFNPAFYRDLEAVFEDRMPEYKIDMLGAHDRTVFVGCDWEYFKKHGPALCRSFVAHDPERSIGLHLHIYDGPDFAERLTYIDTLMEKRTYGMSHEVTPHAGHPKARFYYASARLIRMAQVMARYPRPMLMLDADLIINGSLNNLFAMLKKCDAVVCRMPGRIPFHTQFNASVFGINSSIDGMNFLAQVAGYVRKSMLMQTVPWCLDQIAIMCCAFIHTEKKRLIALMGPNIQAVGPTVYDGSFNALLAPQKVGPESPEFAKWQEAMAKYGGCAK